MNDTLTKLTHHIRSSAALVAAIAALVTSIRACTKPTDPTPAKAAFETLGVAVERLSEGQSRLYDEVSTLQNYVITNGTHAPVVSASAIVIGPPAVSAAPAAAPRKPAPQKLTTKPRPWKAPSFEKVLLAYESSPVAVTTSAVAEEEVPVQAVVQLVPVPTPSSSAMTAPVGSDAEHTRVSSPVGGAPSANAPAASAP